MTERTVTQAIVEKLYGEEEPPCVWMVVGNQYEYDDYTEWTDSIFTHEATAIGRWTELMRRQIVPDVRRQRGFRWVERHSPDYSVEKMILNDPEAEPEPVSLEAAQKALFDPLHALHQEYVERKRKERS